MLPVSYVWSFSQDKRPRPSPKSCPCRAPAKIAPAASRTVAVDYVDEVVYDVAQDGEAKPINQVRRMMALLCKSQSPQLPVACVTGARPGHEGAVCRGTARLVGLESLLAA